MQSQLLLYVYVGLIVVVSFLLITYQDNIKNVSKPSTKYLDQVDNEMQKLHDLWQEDLSPYPYISWGADGQIALHLSESDRQVYQLIGDKFTPLLSLGKAIGHSYMYLSLLVGRKDWKAKLERHLTNLKEAKRELPDLLRYLQDLLNNREGGVITPFAVSPDTIIKRAEKCLNLTIMLIEKAIATNTYTLDTYQTWNNKYQHLYNEFAYWMFFIIEGKVHLVLVSYLNHLLGLGYNLDEVFFVGSSTVPSAPSGQPAPRGTGDHNDMVPHLEAFGINIATRYFTVDDATSVAVSPIKDQKVADLFASRAWPTKTLQEQSDGLYDAVTNPEKTLAQFPGTIPSIEAGDYYNANGAMHKRFVAGKNKVKVRKCPFR